VLWREIAKRESEKREFFSVSQHLTHAPESPMLMINMMMRCWKVAVCARFPSLFYVPFVDDGERNVRESGEQRVLWLTLSLSLAIDDVFSEKKKIFQFLNVINFLFPFYFYFLSLSLCRAMPSRDCSKEVTLDFQRHACQW
jgi:hypothetical protein